MEEANRISTEIEKAKYQHQADLLDFEKKLLQIEFAGPERLFKKLFTDNGLKGLFPIKNKKNFWIIDELDISLQWVVGIDPCSFYEFRDKVDSHLGFFLSTKGHREAILNQKMPKEEILERLAFLI